MPITRIYHSLCRLKDRESKEEFAELLLQYQKFSHCFPKMNVPELIRLLVKSWELLCDMNSMERNATNRKLVSLRADPKADPVLVGAFEATKARLTTVCTETNMELYRIRALDKCYSDDIVFEE